jgi:hypothetical protein
VPPPRCRTPRSQIRGSDRCHGRPRPWPTRPRHGGRMPLAAVRQWWCMEDFLRRDERSYLTVFSAPGITDPRRSAGCAAPASTTPEGGRRQHAKRRTDDRRNTSITAPPRRQSGAGSRPAPVRLVGCFSEQRRGLRH